MSIEQSTQLSQNLLDTVRSFQTLPEQSLNGFSENINLTLNFDENEKIQNEEQQLVQKQKQHQSCNEDIPIINSMRLQYITNTQFTIEFGSLDPIIQQSIDESGTNTQSSSLQITQISIPQTVQIRFQTLASENHQVQQLEDPPIKFGKNITFTIERNYLKISIKSKQYRVILDGTTLDHLQKYFFEFQNFLLPMHNIKIFEQQQLSKCYFNVYFNHILMNYQEHFLKYVQTHHQNQIVQIAAESEGYFSQIKKKVVEGIKENVIEVIRKYSSSQKSNGFKRLMILIQHFKKMKQTYNKFNDNILKLNLQTNIEKGIHEQLFDNQDIKQAYCWTIWGNGIHQSIEKIKELQNTNNIVLTQKISKVIKQSQQLIKKEYSNNLKYYQDKIKKSFIK